MTLAEFAKLTGMNYQRLRTWLTGRRNMRPEARAVIAQHLGIPVEDVTRVGAAKMVKELIARKGTHRIQNIDDDKRYALLVQFGVVPLSMKERVDALIKRRFRPFRSGSGNGFKARQDKVWMRQCQVCGDNTGNGFMCSACRGETKFGMSVYTRRAV